MDEVQKLKEVLLRERPMLFLGAGFSFGSENGFGIMPTGEKLKEEIFDRFVKNQIEKEDEEEASQFDLQELCEFVNEHLRKKEELKKFLLERFRDVSPADFHRLLSKYPWKKIYTVNIDDLVEHIYHRSNIRLVVQNTAREKCVRDELEYVKLHGCVNEENEPLVFSRTEYNTLISSRNNFKHNKLISDIQNESFIFVGASLEEKDIDFYINQYENAGHFRKGNLFFIEPNPKLKLKTRVEQMNGTIVKWTAEQFMQFIEALHFDPSEMEKRKMRLNYSGVYLLRDTLSSFRDGEVYESRLYEGYNSEWRDLKEGWLFETGSVHELYERIDMIDFSDNPNYCLALYGEAFSGKDCILKILGGYLERKGFEVLEFKGKKLDIRILEEYITDSSSEKYALLVENASYYYKVIEQLLQKNMGKHLLIVTTSRNYYHHKKKYYLEGNPYEEFYVKNLIDKVCAVNMHAKLKEKGYLGDIPEDEEKGVQQILKHKNYINFFTTINYGAGFRNRINKTAKNVLDASLEVKNLYIELVVFDKADLAYYPSELLTSRYLLDYNIFIRRDFEGLTNEQALIVDFVKLNEQGIGLKNAILRDKLWKSVSKAERSNAIVQILREIAPYVEENENNYWKIIFESILKEDCLEKKFGLTLKEILPIYYQLKSEFSDISYYWLQLGIAEQKCDDYEKALNHLKRAHVIRPNAYQIQHAIGRNYLKHANYLRDSILADTLFKQGEEMMLELIKSSEYYKEKAKGYSIHCYVFEKIYYIRTHKKEVSNKELLQIKSYIDMIKGDKDVYIESLVIQYMDLLKKMNKINIMNMKPGDIYFQALNKKAALYDVEDVLVESC